MKIGISYTNPLAVGQNKDNIVTGLKDTTMFAPASGNKPVSKEDSVNIKQTPPQVPAGIKEEDIKMDAGTACKAIVAIVVVMITIQLFVAKGKLRDFWGLFFILQFICYCAYYKIKIPANAKIYMEELTKVIEFAALNPDNIIRMWNAKFNEVPASIVSDDQLVSVWDDVKVYLLILLVFTIVMVVIGLAAIVSDKARSVLTFIKNKVVMDYSL